MLAASRAQRACPQCRLQILSLFENSFAPLQHETRRLGAANPAYLRKNYAKSLSTTRRVLQNVQSSEPTKPPTADEIEVTVRQAKRAFGNTLPKDFLSTEEYAVYERLYGAPLRVTQPEDVGMPVAEGRILSHDPSDPSRRILLRETETGDVEEIAYYPDSQPAEADGDPGVYPDPTQPGLVEVQDDLPSDAGLAYVNAVAKNQREYDALLKLQQDFENSHLQPTEEEDIIEEDEEGENPVEEEENDEDVDEDEPGAVFAARQSARQSAKQERLHPHSRIGLWRTQPSTLHLPKADFVNPINELLKRTDTKHIQEAAERAFGGPGLPLSAATPAHMRNAPQEALGIGAGQAKMSEIDADAYIATNLPGIYSSAMSVLVEVRKRLGAKWLENLMERNNGEGARVLDVGGGGAGLAAWEQIVQAEWDVYREEGKVSATEPPQGKKTVIVGSDQLRHRISRFLNNTSFLPHLPDYLHSGDNPNRMDDSEKSFHRKEFDVIIVSHALLPMKEEYRRRAMLDNLWEMLSPNGGVLIVLEKGHPRGFEVVADVRSRLINEFIVSPTSVPPSEASLADSSREREEGSIIAPCTNHRECPMYLTPGVTPGRKDFCHFSQRFIRPPFLQKVLGAKHQNHEDINFSFIAARRGAVEGLQSPGEPLDGPDISSKAFIGYEKLAEAPNALTLPRNIMSPLKRQGHVTMDLCTPMGTIERWTIPKSYSKQAYHDARKAQWGDLWALGAKSRVERPVRLGRHGPSPNDAGTRAQRDRQGKKAKMVNMKADEGGVFSEKWKESKVPKGASPRRLRQGRKRSASDDVSPWDVIEGKSV